MPTAPSAAPSAVSLLASTIKPGAELALMYADGLLKDIPDSSFASMPKLPGNLSLNSPAFTIGHLAIYPDSRILPLLGRDDLVKPLPFSVELFRAGVDCVEEPGKYPAKDVLVSTFMARYRAVIDALDSVTDEHFAKPNPVEGRMRELFPTTGGMVAFMLIGHTQSHLGQLSAWRRLNGLGRIF